MGVGVYIPNMRKPKSCIECWSGLAIVINCEAGTGFHNPDGDLIPPDCPLIEIDDTVWENEKYKLIRMTQAVRINKEMAERRTDERY